MVLILIEANPDPEAPIGTDQIERAREVTSEDVLERSLIDVFEVFDRGATPRWATHPLEQCLATSIME